MLRITNDSVKLQLFIYIQLNDQTVLFLRIQFYKSYLFVLSLKVKLFNLTLINEIKLLRITNDSVKLQLFIYIQLNDQTVLFLRIQFYKSYLFVLSLKVKQFHLTLNGLNRIV